MTRSGYTGAFKNPSAESYTLLAPIGTPGRYAVEAVYHPESGEIAAVSSTDRLSLIADRYVGQHDAVCVVRCRTSSRGRARRSIPSPMCIW